MRVAITGANGFIGRDLCERLAQEGHEITALVRREAPALSRFGRVAQLTDLADRDGLMAALKGAQAVVHLAGRAHRGEASDAATRADFWRINVEGTRHLFEASAVCGVEQIVFMSSSKVFGERSPRDAAGAVQRFTSETPASPQGPYGESKQAAEQILLASCQLPKIHLTILRPPLVYGPGVAGNLRSLLRAIQRGVPFPFAAIDNRRSLVHRTSLNDAIACALRSRGAEPRVFPLADLELSTPALIRLMASGLGYPARLFRCPPGGLKLLGALTGNAAAISRLTDSFVLDSTAIARDLSWRPALDPRSAWAEIGRQFRLAAP